MNLQKKIPDGLSTGIEEGQSDVNKAVEDTADGCITTAEDCFETNYLQEFLYELLKV